MHVLTDYGTQQRSASESTHQIVLSLYVAKILYTQYYLSIAAKLYRGIAQANIAHNLEINFSMTWERQ